MPMKAFITGITGFTGRHLAKLLRDQHHEVTGLTSNLKNKAKVDQEIKKNKPDWIFHLASPILRSDRLIDNHLANNLAVDLLGTVYLLVGAAALTKKPKILITNTAAVYAPAAEPLTESSPL